MNIFKSLATLFLNIVEKDTAIEESPVVIEPVKSEFEQAKESINDHALTLPRSTLREYSNILAEFIAHHVHTRLMTDLIERVKGIDARGVSIEEKYDALKIAIDIEAAATLYRLNYILGDKNLRLHQRYLPETELPTKDPKQPLVFYRVLPDVFQLFTDEHDPNYILQYDEGYLLLTVPFNETDRIQIFSNVFNIKGESYLRLIVDETATSWTKWTDDITICVPRLIPFLAASLHQDKKLINV